MAYQPKSYKKFVATAATATLVATAVVPAAFADEVKTAADFSDVAPQYKEAVDYLVDQKIAAGKTPSTFGTAEPIIRIDAAVWIAKAVLDEGEISAAPASKFTDVPDRAKIYVDALKAAGYVNGQSDTKYNSYAEITRGEAALILAEAYDLQGDTAKNTFTDVNSRYLAAVSALKDNGITSGKTTTRFGTNDDITRGELAVWVHKLETLNAVTVSNVAVAVNASNAVVTADVKNVEDASDATISVYPNGDLSATPLTKAVKVLNGKVTADFTNLPSGNHTAVVKVGDATSSKAFTIAAATTVADITNANQKEFFVNFSAAVDELTAQNKANYEVKINNVVLSSAAYTVEVDETNANRVNIVLNDSTANTLSNGSFVTISVSDDILDSNLAPIAKEFEKTITIADTQAPQISTVEVEGNNLVVTFNDYVESVGLVQVNGVNKTPVAISAPTKKVTVTNGAQNLANGTYTVQFANVSDIATPANITAFTTANFTISDDVTVPAVEKLEQVSDNTFKVVFNKTVTAPTVEVKRNGLNLTSSVSSISGEPNEYLVTVSDNGGVVVYDKNATSTTLAVSVSAFKDANNTVGNAATQNITLNKDTTAPTVVTRFNQVSDISGADYFDIRFNEAVTALDASKIIFRDKDGVRQSITSSNIVADTDGKNTILRLGVSTERDATTGDVEAGTYAITLGAATVKDLSGNSNAATDVSIVKSGSTSSDVDATVAASANTLTVAYSADMSNTALSASNYKLNNAALPTGSTLFFDTNKRTVKIQLPAGSIASTGAAVLTISENVVSETGAKVDSADRNLVTSGTLTDNVKPVLTSAKKSTSTTVEVTFSEALSAVGNTATTQDDFVVEVNGVEFAVSAVTDGTAGDNKVTLTVGAYNVDQTLTVRMADAGINIADVAGNTVTTKTAVTATK